MTSSACRWNHSRLRAGCGLHRVDAMFIKPLVGVEEEVLFAPQHPGQRLPHHIGGVVADAGRGDCTVEVVGLASALVDDLTELALERLVCRSSAEPQAKRLGL